MYPNYIQFARPLHTGLTLLAINFPAAQDDKDDVDFETVLPFAMREFMPQGLRGLLVAALLSAFMSTFAATVNAAPAYLVNDVYRKYIAPNSSQRMLVRLSYAVALLAVGVGVGVGFYVKSLNDILQWIVGALYGGYTAPNVLKFHWHRFNAHGYFWGMFMGIVAALVMPHVPFFKDIAPLYSFPPIFVVSLFASVIASLLTPPDSPAVLDEFYLKVRPWGFWGPVAARVCSKPTPLPSITSTSTNDDEHGQLGEARTIFTTPARNTEFVKDFFNVVLGTVWQTALTLLGCCLVLRLWSGLISAVIVVIGTAAMLKFTWYDLLKDYPDDIPQKIIAKQTPGPSTA